MSGELKTVLRRNLSHALRHGDLPQAVALLDRLKLEDPLALETRGLELEFLLRAGRLAEAGALAAQLLELFPASGRVHYLAGVLAYRKKDYPRAERHLRESLGLYPHAKTRHWLAKTLTQSGSYAEAEALLLELLPAEPRCQLDLAWLYERKQDIGRALGAVEAWLEQRPDDAWARSQLQRLRARTLQPEDLLEEVDSLLDLGEDVAPEVLPEYLETLLAIGQSGKARTFVQQRRHAFDARLAARLGWVCHHRQAYDLALELFLIAFAENRRNFKFLAALETAASRCNRLPELIALYEKQAAEEKTLYGRIKTLRRRVEERRP